MSVELISNLKFLLWIKPLSRILTDLKLISLFSLFNLIWLLNTIIQIFFNYVVRAESFLVFKSSLGHFLF